MPSGRGLAASWRRWRRPPLRARTCLMRSWWLRRGGVGGEAFTGALGPRGIGGTPRLPRVTGRPRGREGELRARASASASTIGCRSWEGKSEGRRASNEPAEGAKMEKGGGSSLLCSCWATDVLDLGSSTVGGNSTQSCELVVSSVILVKVLSWIAECVVLGKSL